MIALGVGEPWRAAAVDLREALREAEASVADMCRGREHLTQQLGVLRVRAERAEAGLRKINEIRNSIVGSQTVNFSEHIYPLVAALNEAGVAGLPYPEARANVGTLMERAGRAEAQLAALRAAVGPLVGHYRPDGIYETIDTSAQRDVVLRALTDTAEAAEAHDRRERAEALREFALRLRAAGADVRSITMAHDMADEIERGPQEPESPVYDPGPCPLCVPGTPPGSSDALCFGHRENFRVFLSEKA